MNQLILLLLALLCVLAIGGCVFLYLRLRALKGSREAAEEQSADLVSGFASDPTQMTAIDQYLYDRCCRYMMERRPFLVESFSLRDLANAVFTNRAFLSKTIKILCYFLIVCVIIYIKLKSNDYSSMT